MARNMGSARLLSLLMRGYDAETIRLALTLVDCDHEIAVTGDLYCSDCGRRIEGQVVAAQPHRMIDAAGSATTTAGGVFD